MTGTLRRSGMRSVPGPAGVAAPARLAASGAPMPARRYRLRRPHTSKLAVGTKCSNGYPPQETVAAVLSTSSVPKGKGRGPDVSTTSVLLADASPSASPRL